jgi:mycofactocin system glycosyltransferase
MSQPTRMLASLRSSQGPRTSRPTGTPALPDGFTVRLGDDTRATDGGRTLVGGSGTVLHLQPRAQAMLDGGTLVARDPDSRTVARLLLDRGLADPVWPAAPHDDAAVDDVTVVVPVQDRPRLLARLLDALPPSLPVVVVDDGSADPGPTRAVAAEYGARLLRHETGRGPAAARNTGLRLVDTDHVAFLDSDVVPTPGWLALLRRHLDDPAVGVVGPRVLGAPPRADDGWLCRYEAARSSLDLGPRPAPVQPLGRVAYLPSAALLARRAALGHGFDETLTVAEDVDLVWRVHESGWRVRYEPGATVRHDHRTTLGPWLRRKAYYGSGAALLAERHGSDVAPMVLNPWTAAVTLAVLAQRRWSAPAVALVCAAVTATLSRRLRAGDTPVRTAAALTALGAASALQQAASALTRHYWPLALVAAARSPRARRALAVAAVGDALLDFRRKRPDLDPVRFAVARRLDDLAYGTGLWTGAVRARSPRALVPAFRGFPVRRGTS